MEQRTARSGKRRRAALRTGGLLAAGACLTLLTLLVLRPGIGERPGPTPAVPPDLGRDFPGASADADPASPSAPPTTLTALARRSEVDRAAAALRSGECARAQAALAPLLQEDLLTRPAAGSEDAHRTRDAARLLSGLYAHACEDVALAAARLAEPTRDRFLEDWRLLLLAESAHALGRTGAADSALDTLLAEHPESPLQSRALLAAIEQAAETGWTERALELIRRTRSSEDLPHELIGRVEALAWELGAKTGDWQVRARAARRLLTHAPLRAAELRVVELFHPPFEVAPTPADGAAVDWRSLLTVPELLVRAEALLDLRRPGAALEALEEVPADARETEWRLLTARALTRERRAGEALALLGGESADTETVRFGSGEPIAERFAARLAWERALAAEDLASPLRSGSALPRAERERMHELAHRHLGDVVTEAVRTGEGRPLATAALRRLFADHAEERRFDGAIAALRLLQRLDPEDTTGASYLWSRGWEQYRRRNPTGAIGYWSELASLYPETREARSGRYWTARAFEKLGRSERAHAILREVAAVGSTDFYRKHALDRLERLGAAAPAGVGPPSAPAGGARPRQPWPEDPALARARLLSDLGLDALALAEIDGLTCGRDDSDGRCGPGRVDRLEPVDRAAREALTGLALARQGKRRASIPHLRRAFPALGGPHQGSAPRAAQRLYYPVGFSDSVEAAAEASGLRPHLVYGMIREESAFDVSALSHAGARGLMQLMPATGREVARRLGLPFTTERLDDPAYNIRLGAAYFSRVLEMFDGRTELALAGYNGGPYRLERLWRRAGPEAEIDYFTEALPIAESKGYVKRVILFANSYRDILSEESTERPPDPASTG